MKKDLMKITKNDAEKLLDKYWEFIGYSRLFIQTALYIGTDKCLELAEKSIKQCPPNIPLFEHLGLHFGFRETGRREHLTRKQIEVLLPYLDRLNEKELSDLAEICQQLNMSEWSQKHLAHRLNEESRKRYHPTDKDLLQELDQLLEDDCAEQRVTYWLEDFEKRHDSQDRALHIVEQWLASNRTEKGLRIAAACLQNIGTREGLSLLDKFEIEGISEEISKIKESAKFSVYRRTLN